MLIEFDSPDRKVKKEAKHAEKILDKYAKDVQVASDPEQQLMFWKVREATGTVIGHNDGQQTSLPIIGDGAVPPDRLREYMEGLSAILESSSIKTPIWGHAGQATLIAQPKLNLSQVGDRQKAFKLMNEHFKLVSRLGGTVSASAGDGRLRTPYLEGLYGVELYALFLKVKNIFDPYGTMNPGVKFGTSQDDLKAMVRPSYSYDNIYDHLPRS